MKNSERAKSYRKAAMERLFYAVKNHGHPLVVAAREAGVLTVFQAAELVHAGALRWPIPSEVPVYEDLAWKERLMSTGTQFFAAAAVAALKLNTAEALKRRGFAILHAEEFAAYATAFVNTLRLHAPESLAVPGTSSVDGRIKLRVPSAYVLRDILIAFARALQPSMFDVALANDAYEISFIYLTLLITSKTQEWHCDYVSKPNAVVFLLMLDDGEHSTEWRDKKTDHAVSSDAKVGDIASFFPSTLHRGVATGSLRRAVYASIRVKNSRGEAIRAQNAAKKGIATFESADYADCI